MGEDRINYTAAAISEPITVAAEAGTYKPIWSPLVEDAFENEDVYYDYKIVRSGSGTVVYGNFVDGKVAEALAIGDIVAYKYDNVVIPQNDIPGITAEMEGIDLVAKARRVQIYYSSLAAFQAKTEMGIDLGEVLATQACAELTYEIDTEIVALLLKGAKKHAYEDLVWNKRCPYGVAKRDHYAGFAEIIELASQHIYDVTKKHAANYMVCASNIKPILVMMDGFKAASTSKVNGPYFAGELNGVKVYVSPALAANEYFLGYNGGDMVTSAAIYAPYMALVPTQLLEFADGGNNKGFATMYDLKMLNDILLVYGKIEDKDYIVQTHANA